MFRVPQCYTILGVLVQLNFYVTIVRADYSYRLYYHDYSIFLETINKRGKYAATIPDIHPFMQLYHFCVSAGVWFKFPRQLYKADGTRSYTIKIGYKKLPH